jgi:hypothetical protein
MFGETVYVSNLGGHRADIVNISYAYDFIGLLEHRNRRLRLGRLSVHADILRDRYSKAPLGEMISFEDFYAADLFLLLFDSNWTPETIVFLHDLPRFLIEAKKIPYAKRISKILSIGANEIASRVLERINSFKDRGRFQRLLLDVEFDKKQLEEIATIP